jgi:2-alkyl-3-oxoalkanoate reductase
MCAEADRARSVAVTGASGFVGGRVAAHLEDLGFVVHRFGRRDAGRIPAPERASYRSWDIEEGPLAQPPVVDAVVHCAGAVDDWGTFEPFRRANVDGTRHVLATWPDARFVHVSSGSVYDPRADHSRVTEEQADPSDAADTDRVRWLNAYGRTKRMAENLVAAEAAERSIILRPHAVYGPGDTQLLPRLLRRVRFGRLMMVGSPQDRISLTHVDNFAWAVELALRSDATGAVNVADPTAGTKHELLMRMLRRVGGPERIAYVPPRAAWAFANVADATHLYGRLPRPIVTRYQLSHLMHDFVYDLSRARDLLGYVDPPRDCPSGLDTIDVPPRG